VPAAFFSTGQPDGLMATASRPASTGQLETESADDFILNQTTDINSATFTGLLANLPGQTGSVTPADVGQIRVEIYHVFPVDSDTARTSGAPTFSTPQVPTRVNSPSDVELDDRDTAKGGLVYTTDVLSTSFTAKNSVDTGINPKPNQTTGGEGAVTGEEVRFNVTFATPFTLPAGHYFFVPQVQVNNGRFLWLSAPFPVTAPGGTPFTPDLQEWIRNSNLDPDWLRVGTDIVGGTIKFNGSFSLSGDISEAPLSVLSVASGPFGPVIEEVTQNGNLIQLDVAGAHNLTQSLGVGNVRSASVAFGLFGQVIEVVTASGDLFQLDVAGAHNLTQSLGVGNIRSASVAFGPLGQVIEAVTANGDLIQFDAAGAHNFTQLLGLGPTSTASVGIGTLGEVIELVTTNGDVIQLDIAGSHNFTQQLGLSPALNAQVAVGTSLVIDVVSQDGSLRQFDQAGAHVLGGGVLEAQPAFTPFGAVLVELLRDGSVVFVAPGGGAFPLGKV
jgi:hypothetical protein